MIESVQDKNNIKAIPNSQETLGNTRKITTKRIYPGFSLISAIKHKDYDLIFKLLEDNININFLDDQGWSALHYAVQQNLQDIVKLLIAKGVKVNQATQKGLTPLHIATWLNNSKITQTIIDSSAADVNLADEKGITPLLLATWLENNTNVQLFINEGADVKKFSNDGLQPIHYAFIKGNLVCAKLLLKNGASLNNKSEDGKLLIDFAKEHNKFNLIQHFFPDEFEEIGDEYTKELTTKENQLTFTQYSQIVSDKFFDRADGKNSIDSVLDADLEIKEDLLSYSNKEEIGERLLTYTAHNNKGIDSNTDFNTTLKKQYQEQDIENNRQNNEAIEVLDNAINKNLEEKNLVLSSEKEPIKRHSTTKSIISKYGLKTSDLPQVVNEYNTEFKPTLMNQDESKKLNVENTIKENKFANKEIKIDHSDVVKKSKQKIQERSKKYNTLISKHLSIKNSVLDDNPKLATLSEIRSENSEIEHGKEIKSSISVRIENQKEEISDDEQKQVNNNDELKALVTDKLENTIQDIETKNSEESNQKSATANNYNLQNKENAEISDHTSQLNEDEEALDKLINDDVSNDDIEDLLEEDSNQIFKKYTENIETKFSSELENESILTNEDMPNQLTKNQEEEISSDEQKQINKNDELRESITDKLENTIQDAEAKNLEKSNQKSITDNDNKVQNKEEIEVSIHTNQLNEEVVNDLDDSFKNFTRSENQTQDNSKTSAEALDENQERKEQVNQNTSTHHPTIENKKKNNTRQGFYKSLESMNEYLSGNIQTPEFVRKDSSVVLNELFNKPNQSNPKIFSDDVIKNRKTFQFKSLSQEFKKINTNQRHESATKQYSLSSNNRKINTLFDVNFESDAGDKNYYISTRGKIFSSIDEMVIVNILENLNMEYVYKREITGTVKPGLATPSFTFIDKKDELIIWEHLHYNPFEKNNTAIWDERNIWYQNNGFNYYINFFMTYFDIESINGFNSQNINNIALSIKARL